MLDTVRVLITSLFTAFDRPDTRCLVLAREGLFVRQDAPASAAASTTCWLLIVASITIVYCDSTSAWMELRDDLHRHHETTALYGCASHSWWFRCSRSIARDRDDLQVRGAGWVNYWQKRILR